jgi:hypothetical protein
VACFNQCLITDETFTVIIAAAAAAVVKRIITIDKILMGKPMEGT